MKRTTTYDVTIYDITKKGEYVNPRGNVYTSWKDALQAYRRAKWYGSKDTLVELNRTIWEHEDEDPYDYGDIDDLVVIYSKELRK